MFFHRFDGESHAIVDASKYVAISGQETNIELKFKPDRPNGILLFIGERNSQDFALLELRNSYLTYGKSDGFGNYFSGMGRVPKLSGFPRVFTSNF